MAEKTDFTIYRPISILPQFSKILEKFFSIRLKHLLTVNNVLSDCQYGFRSGMSTTHAAMELLETITSAIDNKLLCGCIY